ncbi:hypothetical protein K7432_001052 [Basidiobolus ranarum]|uniref:Nucleoporin p58/p45 n=1 Tax=Basidiobolus ranarum TaxID=34480 RepID=A0ABR2X3P0_9FUNG
MFSFGANNTSATTTSTPGSSFSFGNTTPATSTSNSTSLFGNTSNPANTTSTAPASGFSFGTTSSTPATNTATTTPSLFGNTTSTGSSLLGNTTTSTPTSTTPFSLSTPKTTGGISLGGTTTSNTTPGTSLFGSTNAATSTATSSAPLNPQTIVRTSKFSDLPDDAKTMIEQIEKSIQSQIHSYDYVTARETPDFINKVTEEAQILNEKLVGLQFSLERDMELISNLNKTMNKEIKNAEIAGRGINALKSPNNHLIHFPGVRLTFDYFWNLVTSFESRMIQYKHNIEDIEKHLSSIAQTAKFSPGALTEIMRNQHETFLAIAGKVATLHNAVKRQKEQYLNYRRRVYNDDKSPFPNDLKKSRKVAKISDDSESLMSSMLLPSASTHQAPQSTYPLGSSNTLSSGSLFGSTTPSTGTAFGASTPSTGGLFGQTNTGTTSGSTFGASGSLFGNTPSAGVSAAGSTGGLFGASTAAPATGGLFGASTTTPSTGGLFGSSTAAKPSTGFSFGAK